MYSQISWLDFPLLQGGFYSVHGGYSGLVDDNRKQLPLSKGWLLAASKSSTEKLRGLCANESAVTEHPESARDILS